MALDFSVNSDIVLKEPQRQAIMFCYRQANAVVSLQTGLGKTLCACVLTRELMKTYPALLAIYLVPQKAVKAFDKELKRLGLPHALWTSEKKLSQKGARILILTHTSLAKYKEDIVKIAATRKCMMVVDEIHNFSNPKSKLFKELSSIRKFFPLFYGLTACTTGDTLIETARGYVRADEINKDDWLIVDRIPKKVIDVQNNGDVQCYEIETKMGYHLKASYNHPVKIGSRWVNMEDLKVGDKVYISKDTINYQQEQVRYEEVYVGSKHKSSKIIINEQMAELLGWMTGDGWVSKNDNVIGFMFNKDERYILDHLLENIKDHRELSEYTRSPGEKIHYSEKVITYRFYSKALKQMLLKEGYKFGSDNKVIPKCILQSPMRIQSAFIKYLWAADGHISSGLDRNGKRYYNITFTSSSIELVRQLQLMLKGFGINSTIHRQQVTSPHDRNKIFSDFKLTILRSGYSKFKEYIGCVKENKYINEYESKEKSIYEDEIIAINNIGIQNTIAIEVEGHEHYTNGILTHNTTIRNDLNSLYWIVTMVRPGYFGTLWQFQARYLNMKQSSIRIRGGAKRTIHEAVGVKDPDALKAALDKVIIFRQQEYNVEYHYIDVPMEHELWERYREAGMGKLRETAADNWAVRLVDMQYVVDNVSPNFNALELTEKEHKFLGLIKKMFETGNIPIVYCFYLETMTRLKTLLESLRFQLGLSQVYIINGKVPQKERALIEDRIKPNTVTIFNKAGTESVNLQRANCIIYYDLPWSVDEWLQSLGRITRTDTKFNKQHVFMLETEGTIDNYRSLRIRNHIATVEAVQGKQNVANGGDLITAREMKQLQRVLLWCFKQDRPLTKDEVLKVAKGELTVEDFQ